MMTRFHKATIAVVATAMTACAGDTSRQGSVAADSARQAREAQEQGVTQEYANWIVRRGWCPDLEIALATIAEYEDEWIAFTIRDPLEWIGKSECEFWSVLRQQLFGFDTERNRPEYPFIEGLMMQADGYYVQSWHGLFYIADGKVAGVLDMPGQEM